MMFDLSPDDTVASRLRYWSVTSPETLAFVYVTPDGERYAYSRKELFSLSCRSATWLRQRGVGRQDVVLCLVPTSPEQTFVSLGASVLGATTICTMIQFQDGSDILPLMNLGDVTAIVVDQTDEQAISALMNYIPMLSPGTVSCQAFPSLKTVIFCSRNPMREHLSFLQSISNEEEADAVDVSPDDVATIFVTSGTTGQSKLVPKTHRQIFAVALQGYEVLPTEEEVFYNASSFGWLSGYPQFYVGFGQTRVVSYVKGLPESDQEKFLWDLWREEKVTSVFMPPLTLKNLLARHDLLQCDVTWRLRTVVFGGSVFRKEYARVLENLASEIRVMYGSTEVGLVTYKVYTAGSDVEDLNCGKPFQGSKVKVVDENLQEVPPNTKGDILIKHNGCFFGYLKQLALTKDATPEEGWFRPQDLGYVNDKGDLFVEGRQSEIISIGNFKMHPQLLETRLLECHGVHDVAVISIPDNDFNNRPCVCVVQDPRLEAERVVPENVLRMSAEYFQGSFTRLDKQREAAVPKCNQSLDDSRTGRPEHVPPVSEDTVTSLLRYWSVTLPETSAFDYVTPDEDRDWNRNPQSVCTFEGYYDKALRQEAVTPPLWEHFEVFRLHRMSRHRIDCSQAV